MANTWTSQRNGNWGVPSNNAASPWHDGGAQTALAGIPANGDTVHLSHTIGLDVTTIPASGSLAVLDGTAGTSGYLSFTMGANDITISATSIVCGDVDLISVLGSAPTKTLTINGNITGGVASNDDGLYYASTALLVINGNITGGANATANGINVNAGTTATINGDVVGGSLGAGVRMTSGNLTVNGGVTKGSGNNAYGLYWNSAGSCVVSGAAYGSASASYGCAVFVYQSNGTVRVGSARGGDASATAYAINTSGTTQTATIYVTGTVQSGNSAPAIYDAVTPNMTVVLEGTIVFDAGKTCPFAGKSPVFAPSSGASRFQFPNGGGGSINCPAQLAAENVKKDVVHGSITGTYEGEGGGYTYGDENPAKVLTTATGAGTYQPVAAADVQAGVAVGVSPAVGTLVVPAEEDVEAGVDYGNSAEFTGTLEIPTAEAIAAAMWSDEFSPNRSLTD